MKQKLEDLSEPSLLACATSNKTYELAQISYEPVHKIFNNLVCATSKGSDQPAHMHCLIRAFARRLNIL